MKSNIDFKNEKKLDILKFLIAENNKELLFWRERNWNTLKVTVGSYITMTGVSYFKSGAYPLIFIVLGIAVLSTIYLHKNYKRYQERRNIASRLETALCLFEQDTFIKGDSLLPLELMSPKAAKSGSYAFIVAIWIIAVATTIAILLSKDGQKSIQSCITSSYTVDHKTFRQQEDGHRKSGAQFLARTQRLLNNT